MGDRSDNESQRNSLDRATLERLAAEAAREESAQLFKAAKVTDPFAADVTEIASLIGVPLGESPAPSATWDETKAKRKIARIRSRYQTRAFQVVRRCISLMRRLDRLSPGDELWAGVTAEIEDFYVGFTHGTRLEVFIRRRIIRIIDEAASLSLQWRVARAMARGRLGQATADDRRLLRRDQGPVRDYARLVFGSDDLASLSDERVKTFLTLPSNNEQFPERTWAFLVSSEAERLLRPDVARGLRANEALLIELLRVWTQRVTRGRKNKWQLASELFLLVGLGKVEPDTLRQDSSEGDQARRGRTVK